MNMYLSLPLVQTAFCLGLFGVALKGHLRDPIHRLFSLFLLSLAIWGGFIFAMRASPDITHALYWEKWLPPVSIFMSTFFYHFSTRYTSVRTKGWLIPCLYLICLITLSLTQTNLFYTGMQLKAYGYAPIFGPLMPLNILLSYALVVAALINFIKYGRSAPYAEEKNRTLYIIIGIIISLVGGLFDLLPVLGLPLYPGFIFGNIIFCTLTTIAIVKYNLLDIRFVIRRSFIYIAASILAAIPLVGIIFIVAYLFQGEPAFSFRILIPIIILALSVPFLWRLIQRRIDRLFHRESYDSLKALQQFTSEAQSVKDSGELGLAMVNLLARALQTKEVHLLQPIPPDDDFNLTYSASKDAATSIVLNNRSPLLKWLEHSNSVLFYSELDFIPQLQGTTSQEREILESIGAELVIPLKTPRGQLSGILILGQKLSEQPYNTEDMQLIYTVSNHMSVTLENARLYSDALRARANLQTWLNSLDDGVVIVNANQEIQFINRAAEKLFGERTGEPCWQVLGKENLCSICPLRYGLDNKVNRIHYIETIRGREYEVSAAPLLSPDGGITSIEVFRDTTERSQAEERIREMEILKELDRLRAELLANVSHELRTPLATIKGYSSLLLDYDKKLKRDERRQYLGAIDRASDRLSGLVSQLLDMSRLEAGRLTINKVPTSIRKLIREAVAEAGVSAPGHRFILKLTKRLPRISIDGNRIRQVLDNLISNAVKYSDEGTEVVISAQRVGNELLVSIADRGIGIPAEQLPRVFDRMFRVRQKIPSEVRGAGLGLSITKGLVELHEGRIWIESEEGKGTTSYFTLPIYTGAGQIIKG